MSGSRVGLVVVFVCTTDVYGDVSSPALQQLKPGPGWRVLRPKLAWGTRLLVRRLTGALGRCHQRFPDAPPIWIHDISRKRGGRLRWHYSHRDGRDVDIRLPQRTSAGYVDATPRTLDVPRTWFLVMTLVSTCDVEFIMLDHGLQRALYRHAQGQISGEKIALLLQYPKRLPHGHPRNPVVRHYPRHRNHMHVRFRRQGFSLEHFAARRLCAMSRTEADCPTHVRHLARDHVAVSVAHARHASCINTVGQGQGSWLFTRVVE